MLALVKLYDLHEPITEKAPSLFLQPRCPHCCYSRDQAAVDTIKLFPPQQQLYAYPPTSRFDNALGAEFVNARNCEPHFAHQNCSIGFVASKLC